MNERRSDERIAVRIPAGVYFKDGKGGVVDGEILNLSIGGAYIEADIEVEHGREVLVEIRFTETSFVPAKVIPWNAPANGTVVRWEKLGTSGKTRGFGVQFGDLTAEAKSFLEQLLRHFEDLARAGVKFEES